MSAVRVPGGAVALALVLLAGALSGCLNAYDSYNAFDPDQEYKNPGVFPGNYTFGRYSTGLVPGHLKAGEPEVVQLRSDLAAYPGAGDQLAEGAVLITMAIWRPQNLTEPIPVIVDAGPYYEIGIHCSNPNEAPPCARSQIVNDTIDYPAQMTPFLLDNLLPHGYAVVQLAVRGTGTHGGCMDLMGPAETHDLDQAITWLGEQPWSNGHVAMMGVSYDGSTPWQVAGAGNPYLKTIVPMSGVPDMFDLMYHNGSAEWRGAGMHADLLGYVLGPTSANYWGMGFSDDFGQPPPPPVPPPSEPPLPIPPWPGPGMGQANGREPYQDLQNLLCPEVYEGAAMGMWAHRLGDRNSAASTYWTERDHKTKTLAAYDGSVFLVQGLQDWNVDPHQNIPFNAQLRAKGLEMKEWYGQWGHAAPDSTCAARTEAWVTMPCRLDFAEVLKRWYDRHLKGVTGQDLGPAIQVQDDLGYWRNAASYPPTDAAWTEFHLNGDGSVLLDAAQPAEADLMPGTPTTPGTVLEFTTPVLDEDLRFSGLPQVRLPFASQGPGGQLSVWLRDLDESGDARAPAAGCDMKGKCTALGTTVIGHGQMNLRYHAGGETPQAITPGERYVAKLELEPLDVMVPRGHRLQVLVFQGQFGDHDPTFTPSPVKLFLDDEAVLRLPVIEVDPTTIFPVPGSKMPSRALYREMHLAILAGPDTSSVPFVVSSAVNNVLALVPDPPVMAADAGADGDVVPSVAAEQGCPMGPALVQAPSCWSRP